MNSPRWGRRRSPDPAKSSCTRCTDRAGSARPCAPPTGPEDDPQHRDGGNADSTTAIDAGLAAPARALQPGLVGLPAELQAERAIRRLADHHGWLLVLEDVDDPPASAVSDRSPGSRTPDHAVRPPGHRGANAATSLPAGPVRASTGSDSNRRDLVEDMSYDISSVGKQVVGGQGGRVEGDLRVCRGLLMLPVGLVRDGVELLGGSRARRRPGPSGLPSGRHGGDGRGSCLRFRRRRSLRGCSHCRVVPELRHGGEDREHGFGVGVVRGGVDAGWQAGLLGLDRVTKGPTVPRPSSRRPPRGCAGSTAGRRGGLRASARRWP
ncbi:hypothetical protein EHYA_08412 [Embleya hyalina]|uniref:Uncharacterized protein n=1 Tax=Embleya hyalina TaxID=516124 RepID=A0A401Z1N4_9ACTN|nr:hypothetical protein EHYA_08412 [Embleya hyalina]